MSGKRCPHCGGRVPENSLTCPACYKEVPRGQPAEPPVRSSGGKGGRWTRDVPAAALLLSVVPPFFGFLGLGMVYVHPRDGKGYWFLAAGLLLFLSIIGLLLLMRGSGFFSAIALSIALVVLLIVYVSAAAAALLETLFGSVFKALGL
ncbi:MAG: hypothetical protein FWH47_02020 [Methanomassiliicoccaceae archaeon]|nr:hypothetical protein [Methanomassiliicoccaceae archaeon]